MLLVFLFFGHFLFLLQALFELAYVPIYFLLYELNEQSLLISILLLLVYERLRALALDVPHHPVSYREGCVILVNVGTHLLMVDIDLQIEQGPFSLIVMG